MARKNNMEKKISNLIGKKIYKSVKNNIIGNPMNIVHVANAFTDGLTASRREKIEHDQMIRDSDLAIHNYIQSVSAVIINHLQFDPVRAGQVAVMANSAHNAVTIGHFRPIYEKSEDYIVQYLHDHILMVLINAGNCTVDETKELLSKMRG